MQGRPATRLQFYCFCTVAKCCSNMCSWCMSELMGKSVLLWIPGVVLVTKLSFDLVSIDDQRSLDHRILCLHSVH